MELLRAMALSWVGVLVTWSAMASTVEVQGIKFEEATELRGTKLQLNGAGTRFKGPFKVYAAGLYLSKKSASLDEVIAAPGPKRLTVTMLRGIDSRELGKLLTRGIEDNMGKAEMSKLIPGLIRMGEIFATEPPMVTGDNFMIEWIPGQGSVITVRGKVKGEPFKEPEFFKALMSIWLGPSPAYWKLKDELLGTKAS
ncbi:chalcone isomerase family protein [Rhodoferax sp.]|uniref:chalcone isomerase family protein n=1 Tax=Rhodoferax sp. TaxID=50421 RepID=UPI0027744C0E|nr:chalcone isomerase family protein [Rhodoferax sp.]